MLRITRVIASYPARAQLRIRLIAAPLLVPVLTISGLSDITSVGEPRD